MPILWLNSSVHVIKGLDLSNPSNSFWIKSFSHQFSPYITMWIRYCCIYKVSNLSKVPFLSNAYTCAKITITKLNILHLKSILLQNASSTANCSQNDQAATESQSMSMLSDAYSNGITPHFTIHLLHLALNFSQSIGTATVNNQRL